MKSRLMKISSLFLAGVVIKELEKITWNRIVQVVMLLEEVRTKLNNKIKEQI